MYIINLHVTPNVVYVHNASRIRSSVKCTWWGLGWISNKYWYRSRRRDTVIGRTYIHPSASKTGDGYTRCCISFSPVKSPSYRCLPHSWNPFRRGFDTFLQTVWGSSPYGPLTILRFSCTKRRLQPAGLVSRSQSYFGRCIIIFLLLLFLN